MKISSIVFLILAVFCSNAWAQNYTTIGAGYTCVSGATVSFLVYTDSLGQSSYVDPVTAVGLIQITQTGYHKQLTSLQRKLKKAPGSAKKRLNRQIKTMRQTVAFGNVLILGVENCKLGAYQSNATGAIPYSRFLEIEGALLFAQEGTFLGVVSRDKFGLDSIANQFSQHGSDFGLESIFNDFSTYGSDFSNLSPFNEFALNPPIIYVGNTPYAYLTLNFIHAPRIDPIDLLLYIGRSR